MKLTGSQIFVEVLVEQGVDTLFGYPGGAVLNLYDELYKNSDRIRHVLTAHEQGASHAADGYARATGRTGVVLATSGTVRLYLVVIAAASAVAVGIFIKRTLKGHKYHPPVDPTTCEPLEDKDGKA